MLNGGSLNDEPWAHESNWLNDEPENNEPSVIARASESSTATIILHLANIIIGLRILFVSLNRWSFYCHHIAVGLYIVYNAYTEVRTHRKSKWWAQKQCCVFSYEFLSQHRPPGHSCNTKTLATGFKIRMIFGRRNRVTSPSNCGYSYKLQMRMHSNAPFQEKNSSSWRSRVDHGLIE